MSTSSPAWWGACEVAVGETRRWRIGPGNLTVQRLEGEWRTAFETGDDILDSTVVRGQSIDDLDLRALASIERFAARAADTVVHLSPVTADRAVVARPTEPFSVPAGHHVAIFVSSPLWLRVEVGDGRALLFETPIFRPSDTWFGPSPREGELCYATRAQFRVRLEDVPQRPHRATTAVRIHNQGEAPLRLERLNLAVPHLPIYGTADGALWTPDVVYHTRADDELTPLEIQDPPPSFAPRATLIASPRISAAHNPLVRAFNNLFQF